MYGPYGESFVTDLVDILVVLVYHLVFTLEDTKREEGVKNKVNQHAVGMQS